VALSPPARVEFRLIPRELLLKALLELLKYDFLRIPSHSLDGGRNEEIANVTLAEGAFVHPARNHSRPSVPMAWKNTGCT
jgi:hypothetical protein